MASNDGWEDVPVANAAPAHDGWEDVPVNPPPKPEGAGSQLGFLADTAKRIANPILTGRLPIGADIPVVGHAVKQAASYPAAAVATLFGDKSFGDNLAKFQGDRDAEDAQFAQQHPIANGLSEAAGGAAIPVAPALEAAQGASLAARAGTGLANAAIRTGTNTAISAADAAVNGRDPVKAAEQAAVFGAGLEGAGALAGGLSSQGSRIADGVDELGGSLKSLAEEKAFKAAVGNQAKAYNEAADRGVINARGRELLDTGVVGFGDSAQQIADKAKAQKGVAGQGIGDLLSHLDEAAPEGAVSGQKMADELREYASQVGGSGNKALVERLHEAAADLETEGDMTFARAQVHKNSWNWEPGSSVSKTTARQVKGIIGDEMEDAAGRLASQSPGAAEAPAADQFGEMLQTSGGESQMQPGGAVLREAQAMPAPAVDPAALQQYRDLKSQYGTMTDTRKYAQINANRYDKNNSASLGDKGLAVAGMMLSPGGALVKATAGAALGATNKLVRKRGNSAAAVGLDKIGDMLKATPEVFGKYAAPLLDAAARGEQSLAVTHYLLSAQDPGYQKVVSGEGDDDASP